jgi:hypothetical protein
MMSTVPTRYYWAVRLPYLPVPTVVGRDYFILPMVRLAALNVFPSVEGNSGKLVWPVHPADTSVDMPFIACTNL